MTWLASLTIGLGCVFLSILFSRAHRRQEKELQERMDVILSSVGKALRERDQSIQRLQEQVGRLQRRLDTEVEHQIRSMILRVFGTPTSPPTPVVPAVQPPEKPTTFDRLLRDEDL